MELADIEKRIKHLHDFALSLYEAGINFVPMIEIMGLNDLGEKTSYVYALGDSESVEKRFAVLRRVGEMTATGENGHGKLYPIAVLFASEAWVSKYSAKTPPKEMVMPSQDPNKTEAFVISARTSDNKNYMQTFIINREQKTLVGDMNIKPEEGGENTLLNEFWIGYRSKIKTA